MTKNRSMRIAVLVLALALITCCFVGTTFAKYTSTATGTSEVHVASWAFSGDVTDGAVTFNLAETIYENKTGTETDEDVALNAIAPGTKGVATFEITNESEVNAYVNFEVTKDNKLNFITLNYDYKIDGSAAQYEEGLGYVVGMDDTLTVTVTWAWEYYVNAEADAADLALAGQDFEVTANCTMTQKD